MFNLNQSYINNRGRMKEDRGFERRSFSIICSDCGKTSDVPFKPIEDKPVYCRECYQKHRPKRD